MSDETIHLCPECQKPMNKIPGCGYAIIKNSMTQLNRDIQEREERADDLRNQTVQRSHSGTGSGRGKALGGQHLEVDKIEVIKALAKDPASVKLAQDSIKKNKK